MTGESDSDVTRAGNSHHADDTEPRHFTSRKHKLLARRRGVSQLPPPPPAPPPAVAAAADDGQDAVSMLDQRLRALDFMVSRSYRQEALLARRELQPRRFHKNPRLERRWHNARQMLLLQELLEHLHSSGQRGQPSPAEAQSSPVLDLSSPGARVTPEGQSSEEGAERERDSPPGSSSSPQADTASPRGDNPEARRRQPKLFPEIPVTTGQTDESSVRTSIGQSKDQSVKTSTAIGQSKDQSVKTSTAIGQADKSSVKTTAIGLWQVTPCSHPCRKENTHLRSHSAGCVGHESCASVASVALWTESFLSLARQRQGERRMRYLQESSPKLFQQIHKEAVNMTFDTRLSVPHDRHHHSNHLEHLPRPQNSTTHGATGSALDPRPATAGARPPVLIDFRQLRTGTYGQVHEHPCGEVRVHQIGEVRVHPIGEVRVHPFEEEHVHLYPHCKPQTKCVLPPIHGSPSRTVPPAMSGQVGETETCPLEHSPTYPETPRPRMCTGTSIGTSSNPKSNLVSQSLKPDARHLFELRAAVPRDPVLGRGLAGRRRVPAVSERMRQRMQDITRIYSVPQGHRRFTPRPAPAMPAPKEGQR